MGRRGAVRRRLAVFLMVCFSLVAEAAMADDVTITATVPGTTPPGPTNPTVEFTGLAAPGATVTVSRSSQSIASVNADDQANFSITVTDQPTGQQTYVVGATDDQGRMLKSVTFVLTLNASTTTIVTGVFLGPSIALDRTSVKLGQFVTVSGTTAPSSTVTVTVTSTPKEYTVSTNAAGDWSKLVNTEDVGVGTHAVQARALFGGSQTSALSDSLSFAVNALEQCDGKKTADVNCDGKINLVDFSILLFFWQQTNPRNERSDINRDGRVTIVDFSIMLFQWTG